MMEEIKKGNKLFTIVQSSPCLTSQYLWKDKKDAITEVKGSLEGSRDCNFFIAEIQIKKLTKVTLPGIAEKEVESLSVEGDC